MEYFNDAWVIAVLQIIAIDIVLGGDNAIIIALACRNLPKHQRRAGILWGAAGAIILRVILVFFATRKNSRKVNHVGIVTDVEDGNISFIHASSSRGVMISKVSERYWYLAYVQARRYL